MAETAKDDLALQQQKERAFFELAERFRSAHDPDEIEKLGDQLGRMVFAGQLNG
jgi:hypothetical protein